MFSNHKPEFLDYRSFIRHYRDFDMFPALGVADTRTMNRKGVAIVTVAEFHLRAK